jgi:MFS superfamily sulfate permease-like transporter
MGAAAAHSAPRSAWLVHDIVAGLVLATILVPVGAAYAVAAGLPGECALYATTASLPAHALFGSSRILVVSSDLDSHAKGGLGAAKPVEEWKLIHTTNWPSRSVLVASW